MSKTNNQHSLAGHPHIEYAGEDSEYAHLDGDNFEPKPGGQVVRGEEAAAHGRELVTHFIGGPEQLDKVLGRPSLEAAQPQGVSPNRQVRLGPELDDALTRYVTENNTSRSEVIRQALVELFDRTQKGKTAAA